MNNTLYTTLGILAVTALALTIAWIGYPHEVEYANGVSASVYCTRESPDVAISAASGYAEDLISRKVLYAKNEHVQLPLASLTKVMTVLEVLRSTTPDELIEIKAEALLPEGDAGLKARQVWRAGDLINFTLLTSANDGARALSLAASQKRSLSPGQFVYNMNENARGLGMSQTFFLSDTGLDVSTTTAGAYGSARDVGIMIGEAVRKYPSLFEGSADETHTFTSLDGVVHTAVNTNSSVSALEGLRISKTGFTDLAGGNLAVVFEPVPGRPVALVVLGSTREEREKDIQALAIATKEELKRGILCNNGF